MIYFDNAATTWPKPRSVTEAVKRSLTVPFGNPGRGSHSAAAAASSAVYALREEAAELFGAEPQNVVLTSSATQGLNYAIKGAARKGCKILFSDLEHNSVRRPALALNDAGLCRTEVYGSYCGDTDKTVSDILEKIEPGNSVVIVNHSSNVCNVRLPVSEIGKICRKTGSVFIVDASQSAGHFNVDVEDMNISVLCMPGHKGLYGPMGTGLMVFSKSSSAGISEFGTLIEGGSGVDSEDRGMPYVLPERFEAGTVNAHGAAGLLAGIRWVKKLGTEKLREKERSLWLDLYHRLKGSNRIVVYGDGEPGAVFLFNIEGVSPSKVGRLLDENGICVRTGLHCSPLAHKTLGTGKDGAVRISFGFFNTLHETEEAADRILKIAKK
ncbi:MAG: aminotransferase class V-fold PLP-dependent enzyme [Clostridia bacterium]|nr:aminotransferase class V-fold PLP-dependent enzyme [Clostridia bacterium]